PVVSLQYSWKHLRFGPGIVVNRGGRRLDFNQNFPRRRGAGPDPAAVQRAILARSIARNQPPPRPFPSLRRQGGGEGCRRPPRTRHFLHHHRRRPSTFDAAAFSASHAPKRGNTAAKTPAAAALGCRRRGRDRSPRLESLWRGGTGGTTAPACAG